MTSSDRYRLEREFSDVAAEKRLSRLPANLQLGDVDSFDSLCEQLTYLRSVPSFLGDTSGKKVLEIGCGNGWISLRFAASGALVWACDISPKMIALAERYAEAARLDINFETMICEQMSYEDDSFDIVLMHMALHHCDIPVAAKQILRVLKPGGKAVFVEDYAYHPLLRVYRFLTPSKHTQDEHPLTAEDISVLVSCFSFHSLEYSGLVNMFEASNNPFLMLLKPAVRRIDDFLLGHFDSLRKYSRVVVIKVLK